MMGDSPLENPNLAALSGKILALAATNLTACQQVARRCLVEPEGLRQLAAAAGAIGIVYARCVFGRFSDAEWNLVDHSARHQLATATSEELRRQAEAFLERLIVEERFEPYERVPEADPFEFLRDLDTAARAELLGHQEADDLALLATFWAPEQVVQAIAALDRGLQARTVLQISRLSRLPISAGRKAAQRFASELRGRAPVPGRELPPAVEKSVARQLEAKLAAQAERAWLKYLEKTSPEIHSLLSEAAGSARRVTPDLPSPTAESPAPAKAPAIPKSPPPFRHLHAARETE